MVHSLEAIVTNLFVFFSLNLKHELKHELVNIRCSNWVCCIYPLSFSSVTNRNSLSVCHFFISYSSSDLKTCLLFFQRVRYFSSKNSTMFLFQEPGMISYGLVLSRKELARDVFLLRKVMEHSLVRNME